MMCIVTFGLFGHLVNQVVLDDHFAWKISVALLRPATDDSVFVAIQFLETVGVRLSDADPDCLSWAFQRLDEIAVQDEVSLSSWQFILSWVWRHRDGFGDGPSVHLALDLVPWVERVPHRLTWALVEEIVVMGSDELDDPFHMCMEFDYSEKGASDMVQSQVPLSANPASRTCSPV